MDHYSTVYVVAVAFLTRIQPLTSHYVSLHVICTVACCDGFVLGSKIVFKRVFPRTTSKMM